MASLTDVTVPDIGDFKDVAVIEVHVRPGDQLVAEQPLITLESDKAAMEVPATGPGRVVEVLVKAGDRVSKGTRILRIEIDAPAAAAPPTVSAPTAAAAAGEAT